MKGELTLIIDDKYYIFSNFFIAQGHNTWQGNNYWIGESDGCGYFADGTNGDGIKCTGADEDGFYDRAKFTNLASGDSFEVDPYD